MWQCEPQLCTLDPVQQRNLKTAERSRECGVVKKNTVGGSVAKLPNTCQVENKTIGDLVLVKNYYNSSDALSKNKLAKFQITGRKCCEALPLNMDDIFMKVLVFLMSLLYHHTNCTVLRGSGSLHCPLACICPGVHSVKHG